MNSCLPKILPEKWRRYIFEAKDKYYIIILQQNLFHEWSIIKIYGSKKNKLGNMKIEGCESYEDAKNKIEKLQKKRKSRKYALIKTNTVKLGLDYKKISLLAGKMI